MESFGEDAILRAIRRSDAAVGQIDGRLREARSRHRVKKKEISSEDIISKIAAINPSRSSDIEKLGQLYQRGQFLRTVAEVNRFIGKYTHNYSRVKSRARALPHVLSVIAEMSSQEAGRLIETTETDTSSSLGVISDAILSRE